MDIFPYIILLIICVSKFETVLSGLTTKNGSELTTSDQASTSVKGPPGIPGPMGPPGQSGIGIKGEKGEPGIAGLRGADGVCKSQNESSHNESANNVVVVKLCFHVLDGDGFDECAFFNCARTAGESCDSIKNELLRVLKYAQEGYYFINKQDPIKIWCIFRTNSMCLDRENATDTTDVHNYNLSTVFTSPHEFWLSEVGFDTQNFYGLNDRQLLWFRSQAASKITQRIRIYCQNFSLNSSEEKSLQMSSWNGKIIDSKRTSNNPQYYKFEEDSCKEFEKGPTDGIKYSDILLEGHDVPVTDFHIRDVIEGTRQAVYVELIALCFDY